MRVVIVTLGYAPARILSACLNQVYKTIGISDFEHYLLNNHYPVNRAQNDEMIETICKDYSIKYSDLGRNIGLSAGYNHLINNANLCPEDIIIGIDPDVYPVTPNWGDALIRVASDKLIGWTSLNNHHSQRELEERGYSKMEISGINCLLAKHACVNSICAWRYEILGALGGLKEPKKYYGGIESMMFPMVKSINKYWAYLADYKEEAHESVKSEPLYQQYKFEYAIHNKTNLDFASWLEKRQES